MKEMFSTFWKTAQLAYIATHKIGSPMHFFSKRTLGVAGIGCGIMILGMVWSIANTALASIQKDLSANVLQLQWMMNCFGIFLCVPLLTMGKLGDAYGRKRLFLWGLVGAFVASIIAGFTNHISLLIACMGLFGLSGSAILPLSQALLIHQFPEKQKEKAVGLWSIFASLSLASGPLVGGVILSFWGWRWIYWINVPLILLIIPLIVFNVKKEEEHHKPHCDWGGVGLLALIICPLILGIMQGPTWGWASYSILGLFSLSFLSLCFFIALEKKTDAPLFRPDLFLQRFFLFSAIPNACMIGFIWIVFFLIPLYLQNLVGYTPLRVGLLLLLVTLPVAFLSVPVSKLYRKWGAKPLLICGFSLLALSSLLQSLFVSTGAFWPIGWGCLGIGIGWVLICGPSISCALSTIPHRAAGIASGMFTTMQELGAVVFLAIAGVIFRLTDQRFLAPQMDKIEAALQSFSPDQKESLLTNPLAVARSLGEHSPILPALREGFLEGYQNAFWFLLGACLLAILLSLFLPKNKRASS
jgi:EmrB/QacA subfamily drug resistance transporter